VKPKVEGGDGDSKPTVKREREDDGAAAPEAKKPKTEAAAAEA
jgi:hypothetical protein